MNRGNQLWGGELQMKILYPGSYYTADAEDVIVFKYPEKKWGSQQKP